MGKKLFDYVIGNPPYQEETDIISKTNGQLRRKSIFHFFQMAADEMTGKCSVLIYPAGRWIQKSGRGMKKFGDQQLNDKRLSKIIYYPNAKEVFPTTDIGDGISIVIKNHAKEKLGFKYIILQNGNEETFEVPNPGDDAMPLNPDYLEVMKKIDSFAKEFNLSSLHERIFSQKLFGIESDFVSKNPDKVSVLEDDSQIDFSKQIKLFTNDRAGKAGRAKWYIVNTDCIKVNSDLIHKWKVVVSSANAGGQKRDNQLAIFDNNSVFGRARLALGIFDTEAEAHNFYLYMKSYFARFAFLLTDENLGTLGMKVPDLMNYKSNQLVNFDLPLDEQLFSLAHFSDDEIEYVIDAVDNLRKKEMS